MASRGKQFRRQRLALGRVRESFPKKKLARRLAQRLQIRRDERHAGKADFVVGHFRRDRHDKIIARIRRAENRRQPRVSLRHRARRIGNGYGGIRLKRKRRQRPDKKLVWRGRDLVRLRPRLRLKPRRESAHGGKTVERLMQRVRRHAPGFEVERQIFREQKFPVDAEIGVRRGDGELRFRQAEFLQLRIPLREARPVHIQLKPAGARQRKGFAPGGRRVSARRDRNQKSASRRRT